MALTTEPRSVGTGIAFIREARPMGAFTRTWIDVGQVPEHGRPRQKIGGT